jgi:hypothetical protein
MPLLKKQTDQQTEANPASERLGGTRELGAKASAPMTKETYWERKEARDIETGIRIRRSGVWQAALQSVGVLQYNLDGTLEGLLKAVEKAAEAGLQFINKDIDAAH